MSAPRQAQPARNRHRVILRVPETILRHIPTPANPLCAWRAMDVSIQARMIKQNVDPTAHHKEEIEKSQQMGNAHQQRIAWPNRRMQWNAGKRSHEGLHRRQCIQPASAPNERETERGDDEKSRNK